VKLRIILLALFLGMIVGVPSYFIPRKIVINNFSCENQFGPCRNQLIDKIEEQRGKNLLVARKKVKGELANDPLVSDYSTHYKIPDKIEVSVILRKPYFGITFNDSGTVALVDEEGYVIAYKEDTSLPTLDARSVPPQVGEKVNDETFFALSLLQDMYDYYQVKNASEEEGGVVFDMGGGKKALFPLEGDRQILVASLAVILTRLNAEETGTRIENVEGVRSTCLKGCTIDLRYKNPVIR
jgi:hypothetical protein